MQRAEGMKSSSQTKKPPDTVDVHYVIQNKEESVVKKCRVLIGHLLQNSLYCYLMTGVIISDCVIVAIQINQDLSKDHGFALSVLENMVHAILLGEIAIKVFYNFGLFWLSGWNVLDLLVTLTVILQPMLFLNDGVTLVKVMRVLRVFRSIVGILVMPRFAKIGKVITDSLPQMVSIFLFLATILVLFSLCGVALFSTSEHFSDLGSALYTLFICLTQDGWLVIFSEFREGEDKMQYYGGALYFIIFISVGGFIFANLFATITSNLAGDDDEEIWPTELEEILNEGGGLLGEETMSTDQDDRPEPCILSMINETLLVFDKNLSEYNQLHQELKSILKEIHSHPVNQEHEQEGIMRRRCTMGKLNSDLAMGRSGDILSTLITQEKAHIFDSKSDMPTLLKMGTRHTSKMTRQVFKEEDEGHSDHK